MTENNNNLRLTLDDVPEDVRPFIGDPAFIPTREEIEAAVKNIKPLVFEGLQRPAEIEMNIIGIDSNNRLAIVCDITGRGITIGARLYLFGWRHDLGSATINPNSPTAEIKGPDILGYQATLSAGVDTTRCVLFVRAKLVCGWPIDDTFDNELTLQYAKPWPTFTPGLIEAVGVTKEMADNIRNAPAKPFTQPQPGFIQNDPVTTAAVQTLMWLVNASGYPEQVRIRAEELAALDANFDPKLLLLALGIAGQAGIAIGVAGALGIYITGGGEVGWFGSVAFDVGPFMSISGGIAGYVFWTGTAGFGGVSMGISIGVGKSLGPKFPIGVGVNVGIYWSFGQPQSALPAGFCVQLTIGASPIPFQGYASFGYTYVQKLAQLWGSSTGTDLDTDEPLPALAQPA
jgi:hypothetical protein